MLCPCSSLLNHSTHGGNGRLHLSLLLPNTCGKLFCLGYIAKAALNKGSFIIAASDAILFVFIRLYYRVCRFRGDLARI